MLNNANVPQNSVVLIVAILVIVQYNEYDRALQHHNIVRCHFEDTPMILSESHHNHMILRHPVVEVVSWLCPNQPKPPTVLVTGMSDIFHVEQ